MMNQRITQHVIEDSSAAKGPKDGSFRDTNSMMSGNMTTGLFSCSSK
jgi:hypothetical protein